MATDITIPTTKTVILEPGAEYTLTPTGAGDFVISLKSDRGVPTCLLEEDPDTIAEGPDLFNRPFKAHVKVKASLMVEATLAETVITLDVATAPASTYGTVGVTAGIAHQVNFVTDTANPETASAVIYFGDTIAGSVQEVFVHDGDIVIPANATAHVPSGHGILLTPVTVQNKAQA